MHLRDLDAEFVRLQGMDGSFTCIGDKRLNAQGLWFLCPKCYLDVKKLGYRNNEGVHHILCWFGGVPKHLNPQPGRWNPSGINIDDLTFVPPGATSVQITAGCMAHFFVVSGVINLC